MLPVSVRNRFSSVRVKQLVSDAAPFTSLCADVRNCVKRPQRAMLSYSQEPSFPQ